MQTLESFRKQALSNLDYLDPDTRKLHYNAISNLFDDIGHIAIASQEPLTLRRPTSNRNAGSLIPILK